MLLLTFAVTFLYQILLQIQMDIVDEDISSNFSHSLLSIMISSNSFPQQEGGGGEPRMVELLRLTGTWSQVKNGKGG